MAAVTRRCNPHGGTRGSCTSWRSSGQSSTRRSSLRRSRRYRVLLSRAPRSRALGSQGGRSPGQCLRRRRSRARRYRARRWVTDIMAPDVLAADALVPHVLAPNVIGREVHWVPTGLSSGSTLIKSISGTRNMYFLDRDENVRQLFLGAVTKFGVQDDVTKGNRRHCQ
jgi:hypothetical protein